MHEAANKPTPLLIKKKKVNEMVKYFLVALFSFLILMAGCSNQKIMNIISNEKKLPSNFEEIAIKREESPHYQYLMKVTTDQTDFEKTWIDLFKLEKTNS